jgi:hypothetical protein
MTPIRIDFAPPSLARTVHRTGPAGWPGWRRWRCGSAPALGWQMTAPARPRRQLAGALRASAVARSRAGGRPSPVVGAIQAAAVNAAVLQLNLPWRALRDAIGAATPDSIALLALEPDPRRRSMKITAEAKNSDDMIAYVERLKQQELFGAVALLRHEINELDPNRPIRFQLDAQWGAP